MAKLITLTKGMSATVDDADYGWLCRHSWYYHSEGYAARTQKTKGEKKQVYMHREIMGASDDILVDHENRNRLDNRRENLRVCSWSESNHNKTKHRGKSQYYGVSWDNYTQKWRAMVRKDGIVYRTKRFSSEEDAARAFDELARQHFGAFATVNFPFPGEV